MLTAAHVGRRLLSSGGLWAGSRAGLTTLAKALVLEAHGNPTDALKLRETELSSEMLVGGVSHAGVSPPGGQPWALPAPSRAQHESPGSRQPCAVMPATCSLPTSSGPLAPRC